MVDVSDVRWQNQRRVEVRGKARRTNVPGHSVGRTGDCTEDLDKPMNRRELLERDFHPEQHGTAHRHRTHNDGDVHIFRECCDVCGHPWDRRDQQRPREGDD